MKENIDINYICRVIGNLSGIPIRCYKKHNLSYYYSLQNLIKDPIILYLNDIMKVEQNVGYYITTDFDYYGIVNSGEIKIIIGPTRQIQKKDYELRETAFKLGIIHTETESFVNALKSIIPMPLNSILQILCTINYILNHEKLELSEIAIYDAEQLLLNEELIKTEIFHENDEIDSIESMHNSYDIEETLMSFIRNGDTISLNNWITKAPAIRGGVIAADQLRQAKNTFIVSTTLACRAAIQGGLDVNEAFNLSDVFIQKCELYSDLEKITNLQYNMILEYTNRVKKVSFFGHQSSLVIKLSNYIQHNISSPITVDKLSKVMYLSRPYLSAKFKKETSINLTDFILIKKVEEAKRLLKYSNKSILSISDYLCFSSQSHFVRVFKKYTNMNPSHYRKND